MITDSLIACSEYENFTSSFSGEGCSSVPAKPGVERGGGLGAKNFILQADHNTPLSA
jgi:hypothetical protein